ncbi:hypothetical protein [Campylobacter hyointestinalis]|uniref:hypothetical protein n=1 Tax=Campylobacter hyointestinalis TaxID=198 RepID=UPI001C682FD8|nr:hypothetical protein [Campylobacter hyointestinalis]
MDLYAKFKRKIIKIIQIYQTSKVRVCFSLPIIKNINELSITRTKLRMRAFSFSPS